MFRLIEAYEHEQTMLVGGRSYPTSCLVEDNLGLRWYLTSDSHEISAQTWVSAATSGAAAILSGTGPYSAMTVESFMQHRSESGRSYLVDDGWQIFDSLPSYVDLIQQQASEPTQQPERDSFVHLHVHSEYSALDGLSKASEIAQAVLAQGGYAVGLTDHGNCAGHPDHQAECDKAGIKPIFGMEAYFVNDRKPRLEDFAPPPGMDPVSAEAKALREKFKSEISDYYHLVLLAVDDVGLRNLWAMSTEAYRDGLHGGKARLDWEILAGHSQGVIATSACLRGPLTHNALLDGNEMAALQNLGRLLEIFPGRFFIELHTNQLPEQVKVNQQLADMGRQYGVPLLAVVDSHYPNKEDQEAHRAWLSVQTNSDMADDSSLFAGGQDYHLQTEAEVRQALSYLPADVVQEAVANTARIANACTARIKGEATPPIYSKKGGHQADADKLLDLCLQNWSKVEGKREHSSEYVKRFEYEFGLLVRKLFCGYYLMWADICAYAKNNGVLVGPGRGSGGGSLVAYLAGITDLDPVEQDLLFERFMTEGRTSLPDFDVDFPASKKRFMQQYARNQWGEDRVTVVGSVIRLKNKGVIQKLGMAMKSSLPDDFFLEQKEISKIIERAEGDTAGLGLSWSDLWDKAGDELDPYRQKYPYLFEMADRLVGRVSTYGQHAAGLVIATEGALTAELPLRRASEEGHMIAQFDKDVLESLGFVKFDMLTLRNLDTIQECVDLIKARRGIVVDVYSWREEYLDPQVWEEVSLANTLGIFQIETALGTQYTKRMKPQRLADLADLVTIVRPGPRNSGLTESYLQRRDGLESVSFPDPRLEAVLAKTYGTLLYQEDIMQACMILGGYNSNEADEIRKMLGKKKVEKVVSAGQEFVARSVERGMRQDDAAALWAQMAEFARYCLTGDTEIWLAASNGHTATMNVELAYRRLHTPLRPPVIGKSKRGDEFAGPCDVCGQTESGQWVRGRCNACYVWVQKFRDPNRGVHSIARYADDRIRPARILDVISQGPQQVFRVTLENGRSLTATGNHRHLSDKGYREVRDLAVGDRLLVDGGYQMPTKQESSSRNRKTRVERQRVGTVNGAIGQQNYGYADGGHTVWRSWREATPKVCDQCGTTEGRIEHAHLNGDHQDQRWENYAWLCSSCHKRYDYAVNDRRRRWQKGHLVDSSAIVSIKDMGLQETYDVVMEAPHNFVANGILTHNSFGKAHAFGYATLGYWCVAGPTRLYDWDNQRYVTIAKAFREGITNIACYDEVTGRTVPGRVRSVVRTGKKMGYVLRTKSNKRLECSEMHLVLTDSGWRRVKDIRPGDLVASERRVTVMSPDRRRAIADGMSAFWNTAPEEEKQRRVKLLNDGQDFVYRSDRAKQRWALMDQVERQERIAFLIDSSTGGTWTARRRGTTPECGHRFASQNEREVCLWLHRHGIEHDAQVFINGRPADFLVKGVYVEFDGIGRSDDYFEKKFGDEPYVVVRDRRALDRDLGFLLEEEMLRAGGVVTFEPVVSITPTREVVMYDVMMEEDPHNFLADGVVVHNTAWFKFHYPVEFLTSALSSVDKDRIPDFIKEARRMGFSVLPPDINESGVGFRAGDLSVRYGLDSIKGIGGSALHIQAAQPFTSFEDFMERLVEPKGSKVNRGTTALLAKIGAFDALVPNRRGLEQKLLMDKTGESSQCVRKDLSVVSINGLPCTFDWDSEEAPINPRTGKKTKRKPVPKKCTKACRQYTAPAPMQVESIEPYTDADIRGIEHDLLGVYLSSTPFDLLPPPERELTREQAELIAGNYVPEGYYIVAGTLSKKRAYVDSAGRAMGFIALDTEINEVDVVCFSTTWEKYQRDLKVGDFYAAEIERTSRGFSLVAAKHYQP